MRDVVSLSEARKARPRMRVGLLRLTDSAPVVVAHEFGFFSDAGLDVELVVEPSWANIADKLTFGVLDAAVIVPPLAFAVQLGLRGVVQPLIVPYAISAGGNTVTLAGALAEETRERAAEAGLSIVEALVACLKEKETTLGIVHSYSTHNLLLRYWLATAGIEGGRGVRFSVVPPARAVEALSLGQIAGFCAGSPWGEVARRAGAGVTITTSSDIWQNAPEKVLAVRTGWVDERPDALASVLQALLRASKFCDAPENASYTAAVLSRRKYVDVDSHAILATLPGGARADRCALFFRGAVTFPWRSHALWFLNEMRRWGLVDASLDLRALAERTYRPDLYRSILLPMGEPTPSIDWKQEGAHKEAWTLDAIPAPLVLGPDRFCDGAVFDPDAVPPATSAACNRLHKR